MPHRRFDSWVQTMLKVASVPSRQMKKSGRMPSTLTPPRLCTSQAPTMGPAMPSTPAVTDSQIIMPVARSRFARQLPQTVAQLWMLMELPSQKAAMATMVRRQSWARP